MTAVVEGNSSACYDFRKLAYIERMEMEAVVEVSRNNRDSQKKVYSEWMTLGVVGEAVACNVLDKDLAVARLVMTMMAEVEVEV